MSDIATATLFALFLWWSGTGAILVAVGLGRRALSGMMALSLPLLVGAVIAFDWAASRDDHLGVYVGFASAIAIWGWHEFAFLTGAILGPRRAPAPAGASEWRRFKAAVAALAWHEGALLATAVLLVLLTGLDQNQVGLWTFLVLLGARISAKLNLYLGVPNLSEDLITAPLAHLTTYFRRRAMNLLFPVSVTLLMLTIGCWVERAGEAGTPAETAGFVMLATLTVLALIEHWLLVLPLNDAALWRWMLPSSDARRTSLTPTDRAT